ncbi:hypothetical protein BU24DRAFT_387284 [Aaosphaeria arxii CBS 175.79]|uniref:Fatty acid hydroxylase domain-containing protein n=1 Tax=Aaosphaeria arxii CBS 175.79 TaxID=1450172 RepID=A0A6A5Y4C5_9PLEO|nr:uncharacterized protein BU24DRAFT_387284 [Aaosphaeria arxii CBS 175.79]KAF2020053.1 hypothetical protein BU24DRAFT_387284 [Aaosphaeria arxii CBS 175.79]
MSLSALIAPFTLPLASFFAIPMLSSWTTSFNLLFFAFTYTTLTSTLSPLQIELYTPLIIRTIFYILPSLIFLIFDLGLPSLAVQLKSEGEYALPGNQRGGKAKVRKVVLWSLVNILLGVGLQAGIEFLVTDVARMKSLLLIKGNWWSFNHLPLPWTMAKHAFIGFISRNLLQYYIHLHILHSPTGGKLAHWHQTWHHSISVPYAFVANYDHPACYLLHRFLPLYLPAILFRFHIMTYCLLLALFSLLDAFTYSGYNTLPSTIMLAGMARRTDAHMMSNGDGNYGPLGVMDWVHGTTLGGDVVDDLRAEMDKHDVKERTANAIDDAGEKASGVAGRIRARGRKGKGRK